MMVCCIGDEERVVGAVIKRRGKDEVGKGVVWIVSG
jgi:hypothetical protein